MKVKKIPMRMCVGCKELKPKKELLRIVALPTGLIELDRTGKKSAAASMCVTISSALPRPTSPMVLRGP